MSRIVPLLSPRALPCSLVVAGALFACAQPPPPEAPVSPRPEPTVLASTTATAGPPPPTATTTATPTATTTATTATTTAPAPVEPVAYASVQSIFERSCYRCHGARKQKGDLRLDVKAAAMKGGEHGVVIVPGDAKKSKLYRSVTLPRDHEDHMPAKGDPLTDDEIALVGRWIDEGARWPD